MKHKFNLIIVLLLFVCVSSVFGDIPPEQDTHVQDDVPDTSYNTGVNFVIQDQNTRVRNTFIYINLPDSVLTNVSLRIYNALLENWNLGTDYVEIYYCNDKFDGSTLTWNNQGTEVINCVIYGYLTSAWATASWHFFNITNMTDIDTDNNFTIKLMPPAPEGTTAYSINPNSLENVGDNPYLNWSLGSIDTSFPNATNYNYTNENIVNVSLRYIWNLDPIEIITINNSNFSMTFNTDINSNCSGVVDRELNYTEAINNNSEYKLSTTQTQSHSITALNDSFGEGNHYLCLSCVSITGYHNFSCDVKLNFSLVLPIGVNATGNATSNASGVSADTTEVIYTSISIFLLLFWLILVVLTIVLKGKHGHTIQFFNVLQLVVGFVASLRWWSFSFLIGFPLMFVVVGFFVGLIMDSKT